MQTAPSLAADATRLTGGRWPKRQSNSHALRPGVRAQRVFDSRTWALPPTMRTMLQSSTHLASRCRHGVEPAPTVTVPFLPRPVTMRRSRLPGVYFGVTSGWSTRGDDDRAPAGRSLCLPHWAPAHRVRHRGARCANSTSASSLRGRVQAHPLACSVPCSLTVPQIRGRDPGPPRAQNPRPTPQFSFLVCSPSAELECVGYAQFTSYKAMSSGIERGHERRHNPRMG